MGDDHEAARKKAETEKTNYPSGQPQTQNQTGLS
jgi:hypothetical protein